MPTIPVFALTHAEARRVPSLPGLVFTRRMDEFEQIAGASLIGIVLCPPPQNAPEVYRWLSAMTISQPGVSIICVTQYTQDRLNALGGVRYTKVLSTAEVEAHLETWVTECLGPDIGRVLHRLSAGAALLRWPSAVAMKALCDPGREPVVEVGLLLSELPVSSSVFYDTWKEDFPDCAPKRVVDFITLARVCRRGITASHAAAHLGVDARSVRRTWFRCVGRPMNTALTVGDMMSLVRVLSACAEPVLRRALARRGTA